MTQHEFNNELCEILQIMLAHLPSDQSNNRRELRLRLERLETAARRMGDEE